MKEYPSILSANDLLARSGDYLGQSFVAFDKLDGSNIRAEWDRKRGWHRFGSRRRLLDASDPLLGQAIQLILEMVDFGMSPEDAFIAPRFSTAHHTSSFGQSKPKFGSLSVNARISEAVQAELKSRGHVVTVEGPWALGRVCAVARRDGEVFAAATPRLMQAYAIAR